MSEFDIDRQIERAFATRNPDVALRELWPQLCIAIGDGLVADPVQACRKLAAAELQRTTSSTSQ